MSTPGSDSTRAERSETRTRRMPDGTLVRTGLRAWLLFAAVLAVGAPATPAAYAQSPDALDRAALEQFHNLDVDAARASLDRAIAASANLAPTVRARLFVHRGVVALAGQGNRAQASDDFIQALTLDPGARVEAELSTPDVSTVFELARQRVARGATPQSTRPTTTTATTPATTTPATTTPATTTPATTTTTPTVAPPTANADTPPEPASTGRLVGDACEASSECESGLTCDAGVCTPPADAWVEPTTPTRFFFQMGYGFGAGLARANMHADATVPYDQTTKPSTWNESVNGPYAPPGYTEAQWQNVQLATYGGYVRPGAVGSGGVINADPECDADPGHYCVRVVKSGFVSTGGIRFTFGYWITPRIGASMEWRVQTHAGIGTWGRIMASARVHYRIVDPGLTGLGIDAFAGVGFGQIQLRPDQGTYRGPSLCVTGSVQVGQRCDDINSNPTPSAAYLLHGAEVQRPFIQTGPVSAQLGATVDYRFSRSFGVYARPIVYMLFPDTSVAMELALGAQITF